MYWLKNATAMLSAGILSLFGTASTEGALVLYNTLTVQIIPLCVGDIEIAVLTGAILSTEDRKINDRVIGIGAAFVFVMLINAVRIAATVLAWEAWGMDALVFVHSTLFRITLVIAIVGFYTLWYLRDLIKTKLKLTQLLREK